MPEQLEITDFLIQSEVTRIIDVRSPKEYEKGYLPGAVNIPLFSDEERTRIGLLYKQQGREKAVHAGLKIVGPKLSDFVEEAQRAAPEKRVLIHCWRGGMRSSSFAWLLETAGFKVAVLKKGYKAYRNFVLQSFEEKVNLFVLGGMTGSGKSDILQSLKNLGCQVLDIEKLANHKGSAFGSLGQNKQPTTEQFENYLFHCWRKLDLSKPVWVEDECHAVGKVFIPEGLYRQMRKSPVIRADLDLKDRVSRLVREYSSFEKGLLERAILKIDKRLGGQNTKQAIEALNSGNYNEVARISLRYYDKAYLHGMSKRQPETIFPLILKKDDPEMNAEIINTFVAKNFPNGASA